MNDNSKIVDLIQQNQALIHKIAMIYAKSEEEVKDMFQEICIQLFKSYSSFNNKSKLSTWIYRLSINTAVSWIRKEKKHTGNETLADQSYLFDDSPFYLESESAELIASLYQAIDKLSEMDKTLVLLYLDDISYVEIGDVLGISQVNVRVKMNRIKKRLKKILENDIN